MAIDRLSFEFEQELREEQPENGADQNDLHGKTKAALGFKASEASKFAVIFFPVGALATFMFFREFKNLKV